MEKKTLKFKFLAKEDSSSSAIYKFFGLVWFLRIKEKQANKCYQIRMGYIHVNQLV